MAFWKKVLDSLASPQEKALAEQVDREKKKAKAELETKPKKPRKPKVTKTPKQIATEKGEPYISVLSVDLDKNNLGNGSFELDWNDAFIKELRSYGYHMSKRLHKRPTMYVTLIAKPAMMDGLKFRNFG